MKVVEVHSPLSALLADKSNYDAVWVSSLTHSTILGEPDNESVTLQERAALVADVRRKTSKPIIVDIDTGGSARDIIALREAGAYAVIMEDKRGLKQNSLLDAADHELEDVDVFRDKIRVAKQNAGEMKVFARLESLIAQRSFWEAVTRAEAYTDAGADGIMVHSKQKVVADEVMNVASELRLRHPNLTLIAVPTTYTLPEKHPFDIIITANHLMRASLRAMQNFLDGKEVELAPVQDIFDLLGK